MRLPNDTQRLAIIGRTGSGKTQAAVWHLSVRRFDLMPWIVFNFKSDGLINDIPGTKTIGLDSKIPERPGIYIVEPSPDEKDGCDDFLSRCWSKQNVGIYIDEGYMLSGLSAFRRCLTQGRSRNIPMIILSQRPVWLDRFVWSEADFFQVFSVSMADDKKTIEGYVGSRAKKLPEFHSTWYDVGNDTTTLLRPVPSRDSLISSFRRRMFPNRKVI